jgi:hypothetical protein
LDGTSLEASSLNWHSKNESAKQVGMLVAEIKVQLR